MFKKYLTLILAFLVINLFFGNAVFAQTQTDDDSLFIRKIKNTVANVGTEPNKKIKVRLKDGTQLKGFITEIKNDHFDVLDTRTSKVTTIQYANVVEAKRDGFSQLAMGLIAGGALFGSLILLVATSKD